MTSQVKYVHRKCRKARFGHPSIPIHSIFKKNPYLHKTFQSTTSPQSSLELRARSATGYILARSRGFTASHGNTGPRPIGAASASTIDIDVSTATCNGAFNTIQHKVRDGDAVGWGAGSTIIRLIDNDTILSDTRECDALVGHAADGTGVSGDGLDADA